MLLVIVIILTITTVGGTVVSIYCHWSVEKDTVFG